MLQYSNEIIAYPVKTNYLFMLNVCACIRMHTGLSAQPSLLRQWPYHYGGSDVDIAFVSQLSTDDGTMVANATMPFSTIDDQTLIQQIGTLDQMPKLPVDQEYVAGTYNIDIYNDGFSSGVYFIRLQNKSLQR